MSTDLSLGTIILNKINTELNTDCISYRKQHLLWPDIVTAYNSNTAKYKPTHNNRIVIYCNAL
jgi:hypothetical protein